MGKVDSIKLLRKIQSDAKCVASDFIAFRRIEIGDSVHSSFVHSFMLAYTKVRVMMMMVAPHSHCIRKKVHGTHTEKVEKRKEFLEEKNSRIVTPVI